MVPVSIGVGEVYAVVVPSLKVIGWGFEASLIDYATACLPIKLVIL